MDIHKTCTMTGESALERLMAGNRRFMESRINRPRQMHEHRARLVQGQYPYAVILGCSDSRVVPEILFDQGLGDLFIIRVAGNGLDRIVIGSLEYAVEHLRVSLILVLGHSGCGAVTAAVNQKELPGELSTLTKGLQPALEQARSLPGDLIDNTAKINAKHVSKQIARSAPILSEAVQSGSLQVHPAFYWLGTGKVDILDNT